MGFVVLLAIGVAVASRQKTRREASGGTSVASARSAAAPVTPRDAAVRDDDGFDWQRPAKESPTAEPELDEIEAKRRVRKRDEDAVLKLPAKATSKTPKAIVEAAIRRTVDDPDGLEFVEWGEPREIVTRVPGAGGSPVTAIRVRFRTKNQYGAKQMLDGVFMLRNSQVIKAVPTEQFTVLHNAPTVEELMGGIKMQLDKTHPERPHNPALDDPKPPIKSPF